MTLHKKPLIIITATWPLTCILPAGINMHILAGHHLVKLHPVLHIFHIILEASLRILRARDVNFPIRINSAEAFGNFVRIGGFEQQPVQADAGVALGILGDKLLKVIRKFHLGEPVRVINRPGLKQAVQVGSQRRCADWFSLPLPVIKS